MKRNICAALALSVLSIQILAGCQDNYTPKGTLTVTTNSTEAMLPPVTKIDPTAAVNEIPLKRIDLELKENHQIRAEVYAPDIPPGGGSCADSGRQQSLYGRLR